MDKFLSLPILQRIVIVIVVYVLIGGSVYYLVISEQKSSIKQWQSKYQKLVEEQQKLKEFDSPSFKQKLESERDILRKKREEYRSMLPSDEEIPKLITSLKLDADLNGLKILKFEKGKDKINEEYYSKIPIKIEVTGTFFQIISFFRTIASKGKRLVNVAGITIIPVELDQNEVELLKRESKGILRTLMDMEKFRSLTPIQDYAKKVLLFKETSSHVKIKAGFTLYAFTYTGGLK
jgi:type IV pilus assembly protein PilO